MGQLALPLTSRYRSSEEQEPLPLLDLVKGREDLDGRGTAKDAEMHGRGRVGDGEGDAFECMRVGEAGA